VVHDAIESFFYTESLEPFTTIKPYVGVTRLLEDLRAKGLRLGAFSDFPCKRKLELLGLADSFDVALTSEETGLVKPDCAGFDLMAKRLGVASEDIMYVGNSELYDVAGALGAGMRAALITRKRFPASAAEFTFFDFADLGRYIALHANHEGAN
jgi:FMN phosphatase YigB (HAD superfamily)